MDAYLTVEVRHDPAHWTSPPYRMVINWCDSVSIPLVTGWTLNVYDETPVRATLDVIDLDEDGEWVRDGDGAPVTHEVTYELAALPPLQGYMSRGSSTR